MSVVLLTHLSLYEYQPYLRSAPRNRQVNQAKQVQYRYSLRRLELVWLVWSHSSKAANPAVSLVSTFHPAQQLGYIKTALRVNLAAMHKCISSPPMHAFVSLFRTMDPSTSVPLPLQTTPSPQTSPSALSSSLTLFPSPLPAPPPPCSSIRLVI